MSSLKINYSHQKEHVLKDIMGYIGADCWRVSLLDAKDNEEMVIYDHYTDDVKGQQIRDLVLKDFRFIQSLLEGGFKIACEFFENKEGGIITFALEGQEVVYTSSKGRVYTNPYAEDDSLTAWEPASS